MKLIIFIQSNLLTKANLGKDDKKALSMYLLIATSALNDGFYEQNATINTGNKCDVIGRSINTFKYVTL